ncbi:MAG: dienelactone hydrolase family protein [Nakamurella sp.]
MGTWITVGDEVEAYRAEPEGSRVRGGMVLIHEIWGLIPHIQDVADRFAAAGYLTIAPDLLSHIGVDRALGLELFADYTSSDDAVRSAAQPRMRAMTAPAQAPEYARWATDQLRSCIDLLAAEPTVGDRIAAVGFCFGGSYAFAIAAADARVRVTVPFYGVAPDDIEAITGRVLAIYGEPDERVASTGDATQRRLTAAGVDATTQVYSGVDHAFFNDTNTHTYDAAAASDAWQRTVAFLHEHLTPTTER